MADESLVNQSGQMRIFSLSICAIAFAGLLMSADAPVLKLTATTANVGGAPDQVRIEILRWSTDAERDKLMDAWNMKSGATASPTPGRGGGRGGRGGRGAAAAEDTPPPTPAGTLGAAIKEATTVGFLWSSEVAGYALRYAGKVTMPDGRERIILITHRRLGAINDLWKSSGDEATPLDFSVIELRLNSKGEGEGKVSLTAKIAPDAAAKMVAPENYDALPVVLTKVKK
jgi:hypothetical protein